MLLWKIACLVVGLEHVGFMVLESFLFKSPTGRKVFGTTPEQAELMGPLAFNQGIYNGFLAAGLAWAAFAPAAGEAHDLAGFFLGCVLVAGVVGGASVKPSIYVLQALPAAIGLALWTFNL